MVFWVGEPLETFLLKPLQALAGNAKIVELWRSTRPHPPCGPRRRRVGKPTSTATSMSAPVSIGAGASTPMSMSTKAGHAEPGGYEHSQAQNEAAEQHPHGQTDMHIWLDPRNAEALAAGIAAALGDADPPNASIYRANAERLRHQLDELDRSLQDRLVAVADRPYVVFHDAYQYFERRYGVRAVGALTINPTLQPSARRLLEIQGRLEQLNAACVFAEPQFEPALVETVLGEPAPRRACSTRWVRTSKPVQSSIFS